MFSAYVVWLCQLSAGDQKGPEWSAYDVRGNSVLFFCIFHRSHG